ncbi:hypothetical protein [Acidipropionibacterium jensenii]|uniref:hypothetical protein n=1 Tax=Acidipropionibacterium jensenii TaxID=1749 RepID=UPI000FD9C767|nr:hypothetical protein [Acidipropionibacterium jensenii]
MHKTVIFSTGRSSENVARHFRKRIRDCQHGSHAESLLASIQLHLDSAERWISAAETRVDLDITQQRLDDLLNEAADLLNEAEREFDLLAERHEQLASALATLFPEASHSTVDEMTQAAHTDLRTAGQNLKDAPSDARPLEDMRRRHGRLALRLSEIREHLIE